MARFDLFLTEFQLVQGGSAVQSHRFSLWSGTTLIACERSGRRFRGIELDPAYVDVAIERWTAMTGGTPEAVERIQGA